MQSRYHLLAAVAAFCVSSASSAVTIVNGSFELGTDPDAYSTQAAGSTAITGWTVGGFGVDYIGSYWQASDGVRSIDLSALSAGSLAQTLATTVGSNYVVTFDLSGNPDGAPLTKTVVVSIDGSLPQVSTYTVGPTNSRGSMNWETMSYTFKAFSTSSTLVFGSADYGPYGAALDNVSIVDLGGGNGSLVPEPATWGMLLAGFAMVGVAARRRNRVVA